MALQCDPAMLVVLDIGNLDEGPSEVTHYYTCVQNFNSKTQAALSQQVTGSTGIVQRMYTIISMARIALP